MDGKLSGGDIRQHQDQSDEQDNRGQADQQIGEHQLVAQAPQHMLAHQTPDEGHGHGPQSDYDEYLQNSEEGPEGAGYQPQEEEQAEPDDKPECRAGKP